MDTPAPEAEEAVLGICRSLACGNPQNFQEHFHCLHHQVLIADSLKCPPKGNAGVSAAEQKKRAPSRRFPRGMVLQCDLVTLDGFAFGQPLCALTY